MTKEMTFNGVDMSRFFRIRDIIRPIGNKRSISTDDAPSLGVNIQRVKRGEKEHTIKFDMKTTDPVTMEQLKHELAGVLNVVEPVKIVYGDEPDKYYMGLPIDDITPENLTRWFQRSEFKLIIPDGVAHSSAYKRFTSEDDATVSSEKMVFNITNNGTEKAYPIITIKHNAENGYIGLVNKETALELGDREEVDKEQVKRSEMLLDYRDSKILQGYSAASKEGSLTTSNLWGRNHIQLGTGSYGKATWTIPSDSTGAAGALNDYIWGRMICWLGASNQKGYMRLNVRGTDGAFIYGVEINKGSLGLACEYSLWVRDSSGAGAKRKTWKFQGTHKDTENPFNQNRGWFDILRRDDTLQVFWWGSYNKMRFSEIKGIKTGQIEVIIGGYQNANKITHLYLDSFYYRKDFVSTIHDVPNRYPIGSSVVINNEDDTVYIDGIAKSNEVVDGSRWLVIPPGPSELELYVSSFVTNKPTVTIELEERWS